MNKSMVCGQLVYEIVVLQNVGNVGWPGRWLGILD